MLGTFKLVFLLSILMMIDKVESSQDQSLEGSQASAMILELMEKLDSMDFNYEGWRTDRKLVQKQLNSDPDAAMFRLDLMERRQELSNGNCDHPLFLQIQGKRWTNPDSEWDMEKAIKFFKHGRDNFVYKVLKEGDRKERIFLKHSSQQNNFSDREGNSIEHESFKSHYPLGSQVPVQSQTDSDLLRHTPIDEKLKRQIQKYDERTRQIYNEDFSKNRVNENSAKAAFVPRQDDSKYSRRDEIHLQGSIQRQIQPAVDNNHSIRSRGNDLAVVHQENRNRAYAGIEYSQPMNAAMNVGRSLNPSNADEEGSELARRRKEMDEGTCTHPIYLAIQQRRWSYHDGERDKRAALRYFRFGQDSMVDMALKRGEEKEKDWISSKQDGNNIADTDFRQRNEGIRNTFGEIIIENPVNPGRRTSIENSPSASQASIDLARKISAAKADSDREINARKKKRSKSKNNLDREIARTLQEKRWTYPSKEEDVKAVKYYLRNGNRRMSEQILKDGDMKEESFLYLSDGDRSKNEVLAALDSITFSYPSWQHDFRRVELICCCTRKAFRQIAIMERKQKEHEEQQEIERRDDVAKRQSVRNRSKVQARSTQKNSKKQAKSQARLSNRNENIHPVKKHKNKLAQGEKKKRKSTWVISDLRRPWRRW